MTHITQLTEISGGRLVPSSKKLSSALLDVNGRLSVSGTTLGFDSTGLATETYVTNAIAGAQLGGGEVDLSGYATTEDLEDYATLAVVGQFEDLVLGRFNTKVDKVDGKGLSTNDFTNTHKTAVENIESTVNSAIANVVNGAPSTFDTLKEIADWIANDGVTATGLATSLSGKLDTSVHNTFADEVADQLYTQAQEIGTKTTESEVNDLIETYVMETYNPQLGVQLVGMFADKLDIPVETSAETHQSPVVNSLPLYTLDNGGTYVLCTPDVWLNINGYYVPGYSAATVEGEAT